MRIALWLVLLLLTVCLAYLNMVGLPGFVKSPLLDKLRSRGLVLDFSRLRLSWRYGILAEQVHLKRADELLSPRITFDEVQVHLNLKALLRRQIQIDSLTLRQGRLVLPIAQTGPDPRQLVVEGVQLDLHFLPEDEWEVEDFQARFAGARLRLSGAVTHASAIRDWGIFQARPAAPPGLWQGQLSRLAGELGQIRFLGQPDVRLIVRGDARDWRSFSVRALANVPGADTPWGTIARSQLAARIFPALRGAPPSAQMTLQTARAHTLWASLTNCFLIAHLVPLEGPSAPSSGEIELQAGAVRTRWAAVSKLRLTARFASKDRQTNEVAGAFEMQAADAECGLGRLADARLTAQWSGWRTNSAPRTGVGLFECRQVQTRWGRIGRARLDFHVAPVQAASAGSGPASPEVPASWAWCTRLWPLALDWEGHFGDVSPTGVPTQDVACAGSWRAPALMLTNFQMRFDQGYIQARATLDVATRALDAAVSSDVDPGKLAPVLPESAAGWLARFAWTQPPLLSARAGLILPQWTNQEPDWRGTVLPTLGLEGEFNAPRGGAYLGVAVQAAQTRFSYSNQCLRLSGLRLKRPEGEVHAAHLANGRTGDFYWHLASTVDLKALRPLLKPEEQAGLDYFVFTQPPAIDAEVRGRSGDGQALGVKGRVAITNFTFRGETAARLQTGVEYTNQVLRLFEPRLIHGNGIMSADGVAADFRARKVYLTNGFSTADPMVIARAIGSHIVRAIEPYHFGLPPTAHVHGIIPMEGEDADLYFQLEGGPFHWLNFHVPHVAGNLHWAGPRLALTGVSADFYGGEASGSATFDFDSRRPGTDFRFALSITNTLLQDLMTDLSSHTNRLEGRLNGNLVITRANTDDGRLTDGHGTVALRDGLIWDIPLFGILSPALDGLVPGLGSSRASAGSCNFVITNGIIRTDDLEIRATAMRLLYRGTADLKGQVNAQVEALLLRDMPFVGPIVSTLFWPVTRLLVYKVTGSVEDPKTEPKFLIPRIMLMPLHPLRTLKGLLPEEPNSTRTNSPPAKPQPARR